MKDKLKREWSQPKIEAIELKFDKVMQTVCWTSDSTPQNDDHCGLREGAAWNCWNRNSG